MSFTKDLSNIPRLNVILDLDSTIINSLSLKDELPKVPEQYQRKFAYADMKGYYRIFERPYLQDFLDYLFATFNVSVFTAADKDYALFITENIVLKRPNRQLKYMFVGVHSGMSEHFYKSPKDLRMLWDIFHLSEFSDCNTVIIDDLKEVYKANPTRTIIAPRFEILTEDKKVDYDQVHDSFLLNVIPMLEARKQKFLKSPCAHMIGEYNSMPCKRIS